MKSQKHRKRCQFGSGSIWEILETREHKQHPEHNNDPEEIAYVDYGTQKSKYMVKSDLCPVVRLNMTPFLTPCVPTPALHMDQAHKNPGS